ncbi:MAG: glycosyltransferase [bacterium]|nr:glycosyltransferase [bacterium]
MKTNRALILFFKHPQKGMVKTRLAKDLGNESTYELYKNFLRDLFETAQKTDAEKIIFYSVSEEKNGNAFAPAEYTYRSEPQWGSDLGARMYNAFDSVFSMGYENAVLIGSDCPDIPAETINSAFTNLSTHDLVLGPSRDGGYYLVALTKDSLSRSLFTGITWSTETVLEETLLKTASAGKKHRLLETRNDIDELDDLKNFYQHNKNTASHTAQFLNNLTAEWKNKFTNIEHRTKIKK